MSSQRPIVSGLEYRVRGEGNPVVALHGSASTGAQWRSLVGHLEGRFRIYTPDLPGYGGSAPATAAGLAGDARAVGALIDRIGGPVHLVGHSYGGAVALKLASSRPGCVRSLTVIEPVAFHLLRQGSDSDRRLYDEVMGIGAAMDPTSGRDGRIAGMRRFIDYWNGAGAWARTSPGLRDFFLQCHDRVHADFAAIAGERDGLAELARIACPTLAIMGLDSPTPSLRVTEIVARALPRAVLRMIPDAGHLVPLTDPHLVDPMIGNHLVAAERALRISPAIAA
jgi:pimeloyl-ACP methyl ester carboxylesterase